MLGRKQSLKGNDLILADYGPEDCHNENTDIEWVNKVRFRLNVSKRKSFRVVWLLFLKVPNLECIR